MKPIKILLLIAAVGCCANSASAQNWVQTSAPSTNWQSIASSADGTKLVAIYYANASGKFNFYASTNSGIAWQNATNKPFIGQNLSWSSVASSADGNKLVAAIYWSPSAPGNGGIFISTNSGIGWNQTSTMTGLGGVACSADGTKMATAIGTVGIYTSTDSGMTWTQTSAPNLNWSSIASSADGTKLTGTAYEYGGGIYISTNSGAAWTQTGAPNLNWSSIASSTDGIKLAAAMQGSGIYTSTNSGVTWISNNVPVAVWHDIAGSADGIRLVAIATNGMIFTSTNSGAAWRSNSVPTNYWSSVTSSADGTKLAATVFGGGIYISYTVPKPLLCLASSNNCLAFCWTVASTNFVLQKISDMSKTNWSTMTNKPVLNLTNLQNQIILPPPGSNVFYRLKTP
jgi:hypothetical protein